MKKILVTVDGSESSDKVLDKAKELGNAFDSHITILHVVEDLANPNTFKMNFMAGNDKVMQDKLDKHSAELLDTYLERFEDYAGTVEGVTAKGKPGHRIIEIAEEENFDLIVMGSRGLGAFSGAMLGSISNKVVNRSKMSVLIVK